MKYSKVGWATLFAAVAVVSFITAGVPAAVQAQSTGLRVYIPFEFQVGSQVLSPGMYSVMMRSDAVTISDSNGHAAISLTNAVRRPGIEESALVFNVYGQKYFLSEVRWEGYQNARGLVRSSDEANIARAQKSGETATARVAAR